jgi:hypothetical protein
LQVIELLCRSAECDNPVEKSKLEKGSLHDRATSLPEQDRLLANRLTESLGLSTMQIRASKTGRMSRHFSHDLPLSASKPSTRPLSPRGLEEGLSASLPWNTTTTHLPCATLANPWSTKVTGAQITC